MDIHTIVNDPNAATSVPNRCSHTDGKEWRCKEPVCRNLDGTWSTYCQKHKDMDKQRKKKYRDAKRTVVVDSSTEEEDDAQANPGEGTCTDCGAPTRPRVRGSGYVKYCGDCQESTAAIYRAIHTVKRTARDLLDEDAEEWARTSKRKLECEIGNNNKEIKRLQERNAELHLFVKNQQVELIKHVEAVKTHQQAKQDLINLL